MNAPETPVLPPLPPSADSVVRILIVDAEKGNRETIHDVLQELGYQVESAATEQQALEMARERFFHLAILDIHPQNLDGARLLTEIKKLHPDTSCIMITGFASLQSCMSSLNGGAVSYMIKPLQLNYLLDTIARVLAQQQAAWDVRRQLHQYSERIRELVANQANVAQRVRQ
jgi:ATP-dependent Lon protease